jgi:hypothetical protein
MVELIGTTLLPVASGNTDWKVIAAGAFSPPSAYTARIVLAAAPGSGSLWYDHVGFLKGELPGGTNPPPVTPPPATPPTYDSGLAQNGSFENGTEGWTGLNGAGGTIDSQVSIEGAHSARITASSTEKSIESTTEVFSGVYYTLKVFVRTAGAASVVRIDWLDSSGRFLSSTRLPAVSGDTSWKQISVSEFAPQSARGARIVLGAGPGSGSVWFDQVSFTK